VQTSTFASPTRPLEAALHYLTRDVPVAHPGETISEVLDALRSRRFEIASHIAVCEGPRLQSIVRIEELLAAEPDAQIETLGDPDPPVVGPETDRELVAWKAVQHGESALPVVDAAGTFIGMVPPHRLLAVLLEEHDEDTARFAGLLRGATEARAASEAPALTRFWHRIPWLLVGLLGSVVSVEIVGSFEEELRRDVSLAFFIPAVVYLADAVGTQTEALAIRGLPLGISIRKVFFRELLSGVAAGLALAALFFPLALLRWGEAEVATSVAVALFGACAIASVVALALPWTFQRFGLDPAFGSGPLATVIQDLLSIVVFFAAAVLIVD